MRLFKIAVERASTCLSSQPTSSAQRTCHHHTVIPQSRLWTPQAYACANGALLRISGSRCAAGRTPTRSNTPQPFLRLTSDWRAPLIPAEQLAGRVGVVVALGKFDAMHAGHRALAEAAAAMGGYPCLLSFSGMAEVLNLPPRLPLTPDCDRARILGSWAATCGVAPVQRSIPFAELRHLEPEAFVEMLASDMRVHGIVAGANYRFGYKARGDADLLCREGERNGLCIEIVALRDADDQTLGTASSTSVRNFLANGDIPPIRHVLGRNYALLVPWSAINEQGQFHAQDACNQLPACGSYNVHVQLAGGQMHESVLDVGDDICQVTLCTDLRENSDRDLMRMELLRRAES